MQVVIIGSGQQAVAIGTALRRANLRATIPPRDRVTPAALRQSTDTLVVYLCHTGKVVGRAELDETRVRPQPPRLPSRKKLAGDAPARQSACRSDCLLRQLRAVANRTPFLVIAPRGSAEVPCLTAGADDFLAQPVALPVVTARVQALMRRHAQPGVSCRPGCCCELRTPNREPKTPVCEPRTLLQYADLTLDLITHVATRGDKTFVLPRREFTLLVLLMRALGKPCSRAQILAAWDYRGRTKTKIVAANIRRLRDKIDTGFATKLIHNEYGEGYVLKVD